MTIVERLLLEFIGLIEIALTLYLLNSKFASRYKDKMEFTLALISIFLITRIPLLSSTVMWQMISFMALYAAYLMIFRLGKWYMKLFWIILSLTFLSVSVILCNSMFVMLFNIDRNTMLNLPAFVQLQFLIFAKLVQGIAFYFLARQKTSFSAYMSRPVLVLLAAIPLFSLGIMLVILDYSIIVPAEEAARTLIVSASLGVLAINVIVIVLYNQIALQAERILEQETSLQQNSLKQVHYLEVNAIYDEMRAWRHDYHNHLQALKGMLITDNYRSLGKYLASIESSTSRIEAFVETGNDLIDAILNAKLSLAQASDIDVDISVQLPASIHMESTDLCSLIGNLLDNAIEACKRITEANIEHFIALEISTVKGQLGIEISNSSSGRFNKRGSTYFTVKESRMHGLGLKQIDSIVEKYSGYIDRDYRDNIFKTIVSLPVC